MRVVILGGSGFIGRALTRSLVGDGHEVVVVSRRGGNRPPAGGVVFAPFDGKSGQGWAHHLEGAFALVNLAGENIASGYWTKARKARILNSRVAAGRAVMDALGRVDAKPAALLQGSAVGYYGDRGEVLTVEDAPRGRGFLADVAGEWEASTAVASALGVRRVLLRTAVVLGRGGGALPRMLAPYRFFLGGPLGSGRQWFPWIHLDDEVRAIRFLLEREEAVGPYNLAAPEAVTQEDLAAAIGKALARPSRLRIPETVLRLALGQMAQELFLQGARIVPHELLRLGFSFRFPTLAAALDDILGGPDAPHA
ncbi:TIGR01777 family oxidoreductase [Desulfovibrio sp. TomC]|uniref:TIGR01777 family oxidoreductase n=1 Tax=Desulfovibrio sp. TomC TaxID=1562888 RepID=UPI000575908A|nr:TIGR01777 family oxidoreductase [Desulfovibrio sp. TomC]KHK04196.1 Cell division inhibitor [Desulfovibrio sp. TomC]